MTQLLRVAWKSILQGNRPHKQLCALRRLCSNLEMAQNRPQDTAMVTLKVAASTTDVLAAVQNHLPSMTHKHLLQALRSIFELQKGSKSRSDMEMLTKDPAFTVLCQNFKKHARSLDVNEAIEATKILSYLQVPADTLLVQTMLQLIRFNVNYISVRQVMFLDFLLSKFNTKNHLVDALQLALPLVFQIHMPLELDHEDLPLLREMLAYSCAHGLPDRCINNVVTGLLLHEKSFDVQTAKSVVWSLCECNCTVELYPTRAKLLNVCFGVMTRSMDMLNYDDVLRTAAKLKSRIVEKHPEYYNEGLMDAIADYVVKNVEDLERSMLVARGLSRIAHTHLGIVEYICYQVASDPNVLSNAAPNLILGFVNCLANNNYIPDLRAWTEVRRQIISNPIMESKNVVLPWAKFCLELASLGIYEDKLLTWVFSKEFLDEYLYRERNCLDYLQILTLYEAVKSFHSDEYSVPEAVLTKARSLYPVHTVTERVAEALARGLGGREYIAKNVVLPSGIIADSVICLKNGFPQALNIENKDGKLPIDQLKLPEASIVICLMTFNQGCYSMNSNRLRGTFRLIVDIMEKQGYATVPLNVSEWVESPDHEHTPYLIREVGYRCSELGVKLSTV